MSSFVGYDVMRELSDAESVLDELDFNSCFSVPGDSGLPGLLEGRSSERRGEEHVISWLKTCKVRFLKLRQMCISRKYARRMDKV